MVFTRLVYDQTFEVKVQLYISNQRCKADFSRPLEGAVPVTQCFVFLVKTFAEDSPQPQLLPYSEAGSSNWIYSTVSFAILALPEIPLQKADLRRTSDNPDCFKFPSCWLGNRSALNCHNDHSFLQQMNR